MKDEKSANIKDFRKFERNMYNEMNEGDFLKTLIYQEISSATISSQSRKTHFLPEAETRCYILFRNKKDLSIQ